MAQARKFQFSLKWLFAPVLLVSLGSGIWAYYNPPLRLIEVGRYPITVDYDRTLEEMIAAGKYDFINSKITLANFPIESGKSGQQKPKAIIIRINQTTTAEELLKAMDRKDWRPGTLPERLALGEAYPALQRNEWIIALGSRWQDGGYWYVPGISGLLDACNLCLYHWTNDWSCYYRFLAFHKPR